MGIFSRLFGKRATVAPNTPPAHHPLPTPANPQPSAPAYEVSPLDWRTSPLHLMALERFLDGRRADGGIPIYWATSLKESPQAVVQRFIVEGLLVPVPLVRAVEYGSNGSELKAMAKERGLKVSGRKEEIAQRLIEADPKGMAARFQDTQFFTCSPEARAEVERFRTQRRVALDQATTAVRTALQAHDFRTAIEVARSYRATEQKIEAPTSWTLPDPETTVDWQFADLERIYAARPRILRELLPEDWHPLATVVAMGRLLGQMHTSWLPDTFKGVEKFDHEVALRMLQFHLGHLDDVARMRANGVTTVKVLDCGGGSCAACVKMAAGGKARNLDGVPELPYEHCTCHLGCRCTMVAEIGME